MHFKGLILVQKEHIVLKKIGKKMLAYSYLWIEKLAITDEKYCKWSCHITMKTSVAKELQRASMRDSTTIDILNRDQIYFISITNCSPFIAQVPGCGQ